jgi:hypothetical protein
MKKIIPVLLIISAFFVQPVFSQIDSLRATYAVKDTQDIKPTLFDTDDVFNISLKFDIPRYKKARSDTMYLDAVLTYYINDKDSVVKNIKVRARGNIRRTAICDFPPLMLNFKMKDPSEKEFAGINKLKIVPYCRIGYEQYVLKEYLVYKLYNVLTDFSLRVRLFKITYLSSVKEKKPLTQYGFALEPISIFEKRTGTKELNYSITQRNIRPEVLARAAIFNFMISNTDWSVPIKHNVILFTDAKKTNANDNLIVPYDFDYSGIVGTDYAVPFESLPIKTVHDHLYMAVCRSETEFADALNEFKEKKDEFYKIINTFPYITESSRKDMNRHIDDFFYLMDKRNSLVKKLRSDCNWFETQSNLRVR